MTATIARPKPKKAAASKKESPYKRLHVIIPIEDMLWASQQRPSVTQLWQECWTADPYGSRWMALSTALGYSSFICAKKILAESGLFIFKPDKSIQDGRETVGWMVKNLHGSRMKEFWEKANSLNQQPNSEKRESNAGDSEKDAAPEEMRALNQASILGQSESEQRFCEPSRTAQEHLTNSSNELVRCFSDTLNEILDCEETAHAPLGGASPQIVESVSEKEKDLPAAMDCTSLALVDAREGESASLLVENQDCGVEPKDCHEAHYSAAPVVQNEFCLSSAIANQTQEEVEQSNPTSLLAENQDCGVELRDCHEGTYSAAPVSLNQSEIFEWLDRANLGECPPLWVIQYLLDSKYYASMRATISKFEKQWNISVVNYQVQKSSEALFTTEDIALQQNFIHESGQYAEMETGSTKLAFADNELALSNLTNGFQENNLNNKPAGVEIGFTTDDVDAAFNRAVEAGAVSLVVPKQKPWGQKVGYVRDLDGILIEIASLHKTS